MPLIVADVVSTSSPGKIFEPIIGVHTVEVPTLQTFGFRTNESL